MPDFTKPTPARGTVRLLPDSVQRKPEPTRPDLRARPFEKGRPQGKVRGGRPPRFPGRTGGR